MHRNRFSLTRPTSMYEFRPESFALRTMSLIVQSVTRHRTTRRMRPVTKPASATAYGSPMIPEWCEKRWRRCQRRKRWREEGRVVATALERARLTSSQDRVRPWVVRQKIRSGSSVSLHTLQLGLLSSHVRDARHHASPLLEPLWPVVLPCFPCSSTSSRTPDDSSSSRPRSVL